MQVKQNLAARIGRWSARHRRLAIAGWLAFVAAAFVVGGMAGTRTLDYAESGVGESGRADRAVYHAFPKTSEEGVLVQSTIGEGRQPGVPGRRRRRHASARADAGRRPRLQSRIATAAHTCRPTGTPRSSVYELPGDAAAAKAAVDRPVAEVGGGRQGASGVQRRGLRDATSEKGLQQVISRDLHKAEFVSLPLTIAILLLAFGAIVVAGAPVLLALSAVLATVGIVGPISQIAPVSDSISSVVLLIGLAVGVDYALFYVRRVREERAAGRDGQAAIEAAAATSGRAVLISGFTVVTAMAGMYLAGAADFSSYATGTIVVVALAMVGSLTVLPALLSAMGGRVDKNGGRILRRVKRAVARLDIWGRITDRVLRRPLVVVRRGDRDPGRPGSPGHRHEDGVARARGPSAGPARGADVQPRAGRVPERERDCGRRRPGRRRHRAGDRPRDRAPPGAHRRRPRSSSRAARRSTRARTGRSRR